MARPDTTGEGEVTPADDPLGVDGGALGDAGRIDIRGAATALIPDVNRLEMTTADISARTPATTKTDLPRA